MRKSGVSISFSILVSFILLSFFVSCAVPTQFSGDGGYELKYQLEEGTKFTLTSSGEMNSYMDQMGTEIVADIYGKGEDIYVVLSSEGEKGLKLELEFGERSQDVESTAGSLSSDFSDLIGKKAKFVLLPTGKVEGFEGFDDLPEITLATGEALTTETYQLGVRATFPMLPDRRVKIGDSWTDNQDMDIPVGGGTLLSNDISTYTLLEETEWEGFECLKIGVTGISKLSGDFEQDGTALSLERETKSSGTLYFAYKKGMFVRIESESSAEGIITVPAADLDIPQTLSSKGTVTVLFEK
jgi:hypothetical protein